jgi:hypothetical protein
MGLPVPSDMDGHVLEAAFDEGYLQAYPPQIQEVLASEAGPGGIDYTEEGEKEIMERLEGLGYLG